MIMTEQEVYRLAGNYPDAQRPSELRALHVRNYVKVHHQLPLNLI